jgi:polyisoprenoid-binding protein YceI
MTMHATALLLIPLLACAAEPDAATPTTPEAPLPAAADAEPNKAQAGQAELNLDMGRSSLAWVGAKLTGSHDGGFTDISGDVLVDDGRVVGTRATIQINSIFTDATKLTAHLLSPDFFDMASFTTSTFESTLIEADHTKPGTHKITGNLSLHGRTQEISFPAKIEVGEGTVHTTAEFSIDRTLFGIDYPGKADNLIKDDVQIKLDLHYGGVQTATPAE